MPYVSSGKRSAPRDRDARDLYVTHVVADAADHAAWNKLPVAAGGVCGKHGADRFGAAAVLPFLSVRPARQHAGGARGCRIAGARRQAMGFGNRSDELGFWQDHDQHPDDLGNMERHGHSAAVDAAANGWKLAHVGADRAS